jgi:hypothetical protein
MCFPPTVARLQLEIHVSAATNIQNKEELLDASFSVQSVTYEGKLCVIGARAVE